MICTDIREFLLAGGFGTGLQERYRETMKRPGTMLLLMIVAGVMLCVPQSTAQVTATATTTVTLTILTAPSMNFTPVSDQRDTALIITPDARSDDPGIAFQSFGNAMVKLRSSKSATVRFYFKRGQVRTFTAGELKGVSSVEIVCLGS